MAIEKFEDFVAWQKSQKLAVNIYHNFKELRDFGFRDQICIAAVSVSNNIAEGFERSVKPGSNKEFIRFLLIAKGLCGEAKSMVYFSHKLEYLPESVALSLVEGCMEISKIIRGLMNSLNKLF